MKAKKALIDSGSLAKDFSYSRGNFGKKKKSAEMYYWIFKFGFIFERWNRDSSNDRDSRRIW